MRMKTLCLLSIMCVVFLFAGGKTVSASTYSQLQEAQKDKEEASKNADRVEENIGDLNKERAGLQTYLDQLNSELLQTSGELAGIEDLISQKETALVEMQEELETAKEKEADQYIAMKKRIKLCMRRVIRLIWNYSFMHRALRIFSTKRNMSKRCPSMTGICWKNI